MIVHAIGPPHAKIIIVGEAPGRDEERFGRPFVGSAGKLLNRMLEEAGIERTDCYITNVMEIRPHNNDFGDFYEDSGRKQPKEMLIEGIRRLKKEVYDVNPNVVIVLGNEALKALTGRTGITKMRGSILTTNIPQGTLGPDKSLVYEITFKVIPVLHPAAIMRQWEHRPLAILDLKRAKEESESPQYVSVHRNWEKVETISGLKALVNTYIKYAKYISFDIETMNKQITCIGFARDEFNSFTIPIHMDDKSFWSTEEEFIVWREVQRLLESDIPKITQNGNYDMYYLKQNVGIDVKNTWMDTMNAFHCLYPELPKGLATLCSIYTKHPYYKDMIGTEYYHYNCLDCMITYECAMAIEQELIEMKMDDFYHKHISKVEPILLDMQVRGVKIDVKKRAIHAERLKKEAIELQNKLNNAAEREINVNSPKQMADFLYKELELPVQTNRKTGKTSTNEQALNTLSKMVNSPLFDIILSIRDKRKTVSTYLEAEIDPDGRYRSSYLISGTETGRLASRSSSFGTGGNLQNVPKGICREVFIPDEGYMFMSADLSQAEARVVAYLSGDEALMEVFNSGGDVHTRVASMLFNKKEKDITQGERALGKTIVHASNYSMGPRSFAEHTGMSVRDAKEKLNRYHITFPKVKLWHLEVARELRRSKTLVTPMGRRRSFFGRWNDALLRDGYAYIPQSTVSDVILKGMVNLWKSLPPDCKIVFNIHDEIVIQIPEVSLIPHDTLKMLMIDCMTIPIEINGKTLTIPVNVKTGSNWQEVS
jgi:DNA polymerase-1